jgi:hydroxyacylglutathione hydrolase
MTTNNVTITALPAFSDNYIWAIANSATVVLVDPGDAEICIRFIEDNHLTLNAILITHHHADHTGGIKKLKNYCQQKQWSLTIYGPAHENIPHCDINLSEKNQVNLTELAIQFSVIDLPGHTAGHIAYFSDSSKNPILFCGDTLFSGGCGRIFEGTADQMLTSLTKLASLPGNTKVYCAHEYTQANLNFALAVDPTNNDLKDYNKKVNDLRSIKQATLPTSIKVEKKINPFLRSHEKVIQQSAMTFDNRSKINALDTFTIIRRWKDQF